ncbi:hypothetical protein GE21DRAFT_1275400 [Neurospora crassa]|nr:hypothetical protein GE21DRAFT_1275400 [Neurospora crassa]
MWMLLCLCLYLLTGGFANKGVGVMLCPLCAFDHDVRLESGLRIDGLQRCLDHLVNVIHRACILGYPVQYEWPVPWLLGIEEIDSVRIEWAEGAGVVGDEVRNAEVGLGLDLQAPQ